MPLSGLVYLRVAIISYRLVMIDYLGSSWGIRRLFVEIGVYVLVEDDEMVGFELVLSFELCIRRIREAFVLICSRKGFGIGESTKAELGQSHIVAIKSGHAVELA